MKFQWCVGGLTVGGIAIVHQWSYHPQTLRSCETNLTGLEILRKELVWKLSLKSSLKNSYYWTQKQISAFRSLKISRIFFYKLTTRWRLKALLSDELLSITSRWNNWGEWISLRGFRPKIKKIIFKITDFPLRLVERENLKRFFRRSTY